MDGYKDTSTSHTMSHQASQPALPPVAPDSENQHILPSPSPSDSRRKEVSTCTLQDGYRLSRLTQRRTRNLNKKSLNLPRPARTP